LADPVYWLDTNTYIEAKNRYYAFDVAPGFWQWLDMSAEAGLIRSPDAVRKELIRGKDDLAAWVKSRKPPGLFTRPDNAAQEAYRAVAEHVYNSYDQPNSQAFLSGADPWLIAHALSTSGFVVTHENFVGPTSRQTKIPNVCSHFNLQWTNIFEVARKLGLKLTVLKP
jgi:hypothetical protein